MMEERKVKVVKKAQRKPPHRAIMSADDIRREELLRSYRRYVRLSEDVKAELKAKFGIRL